MNPNYVCRSFGFVASGFMPDEKRPDAMGFHSFGFVASGFMPDEKSVGDEPRRYGFFSFPFHS
jgi:hypothetical protein